jgi:hypothetical protein
MRKMVLAVAALAVGVACASQGFAQNQLANPGFESPLTVPSTSVGDWFPFGSGAGGAATQVGTMPRSGQMHMDLTTIGSAQFAGVYQDLPATPGQTVVFKGWHKAVGDDLATHEIKIEWPGSPNGQNRIDVFNITSDYTQFTHSAVVPAGSATARVTYAISSFGMGQGDATTYIDDFEAWVTPEPTSAGLLGLGLLALVRRRK